MNIQSLEVTMAQTSEFLMTPVIILICSLVVYAIYALGRFFSQYLVRKQNKFAYVRQIAQADSEQVTSHNGYPIHN